MENSIAILSRTNLGLRPFEQALSDAGIKYHLVGGSGFWTQPEIKTILAYLVCCSYPADYALATAIRSPFHPTKFLPKTKLLARIKELREKDDTLSYWKLLTTEPHTLVDNKNLNSVRDFTTFIHGLSRYTSFPAADALKQVVVALRAVEYYHEEEASPDNDPIGNLNELIKIAGRFGNCKDFLDYCRKVTAASKSKKGVALATVHAAKGLEWNSVYLVGCSEGVMPHAKSTDPQEEASIFFVAASRAERELVISYSGVPSPFIKKYVPVSEPVV